MIYPAKRIILFFVLLCLLAGGACARIFETDSDRQARLALLDLVDIQEKYRQENGKYARNIGDLDKYRLQYHTGIVYLEIESADKDKYRAFALAAESTTARVFVFDTDKGGFYEMNDEDVGRYVLGALKHIHKRQDEKKMSDLVSLLLLTLLAGYALKISLDPANRGHLLPLASYLASLVPLGWTLAAFNHLDKHVPIIGRLQILFISALALAAVSLLAALAGFGRIARDERTPGPVTGLCISGALLSAFSLCAIAYLWYFHKLG